jgi:hypothetical protein
MSEGSRFALLFFSSIIVVTLISVLLPESAFAKEDDQNRSRFYGWIESKPEGLHGTWIIGGRQVTTGPQTEFDQEDGPFVIGGCAKVEFRNNGVHEIDSEPPHNCR